MVSDKVGYAQVVNVPAQVKAGPAGFFGIVAVTAVTLCSVYDSLTGSGVLLWEGPLVAGQVVDFGGLGIAAKNGIYVLVGGSGTVNILYT